MITVTPQAAEQIAKSSQQAGAGGVCLRLAARLDDKGVLEYGMGFDDKADGDTQVVSNEVTILISPGSSSSEMTMAATGSPTGGCSSGGPGASGGGCSMVAGATSMGSAAGGRKAGSYGDVAPDDKSSGIEGADALLHVAASLLRRRRIVTSIKMRSTTRSPATPAAM